MAAKPINPVLKQVLELGPTVAFFLIYLRIREEVFVVGGTEYSGFIVAALAFIPILLVAMGALWLLTKELSRMQLFTAFMVIFFGGLTAYFNDERFFKIKTTIVYSAMAVVLSAGLVRGRSLLQFLMAEAMPLQPEGWIIFTRRICYLFIALAVANELIWRNLSTDTWVKLETFAFPVVMIVYMVAQVMLLQQYLIEETDPEEEPEASEER